MRERPFGALKRLLEALRNVEGLQRGPAREARAAVPGLQWLGETSPWPASLLGRLRQPRLSLRAPPARARRQIHDRYVKAARGSGRPWCATGSSTACCCRRPSCASCWPATPLWASAGAAHSACPTSACGDAPRAVPPPAATHQGQGGVSVSQDDVSSVVVPGLVSCGLPLPDRHRLWLPGLRACAVSSCLSDGGAPGVQNARYPCCGLSHQDLCSYFKYKPCTVCCGHTRANVRRRVTCCLSVSYMVHCQ